MANRAIVSLGSNIDKEQNLPAAVRILGQRCQIIAVSEVYETAPIGAADQPSFFNAAVLVETELSAAALKRDVLTRLEKQLKRVRTADRNAPRTIDADLTLFNDEVFDLDAERHIPEPDLLKYPHVALPVADLWPDEAHPETGELLGRLAARLLAESEAQGEAPPLKRKDIVLVDSA